MREETQGSKVTAKWVEQLGKSVTEAKAGAGKLTREGRMWCGAVKGTGIGESVCAC